MRKLTIQICLLLTLLGNSYGAITFYEWGTEPTSLGGVYYTMITGSTPASDLILEYLMGSNTNTAVITKDTSQSLVDGAILSNMSWTEGTNGFATGNGYYTGSAGSPGISMVNNSLFPSGNDKRTVSGWWKMDSLTGNTTTMFSYGKNTSRDYSWIYMSTSSNLQFSAITDIIRFPDVNYDLLGTSWHYFILSYPATTIQGMRCWVDGVEYTNVLVGGQNRALTTGTLHPSFGGKIGNRSYAATDDYIGSYSAFRFHDTNWTDALAVNTTIVEKAEMGLLSEYLETDREDYTNTVINWTGAVIQDGSPNNITLATASSPTMGGTTDVGWGDFDGSANLITGTHTSGNGTNLTICGWFNPDDTDGAILYYPFSYGDGTTGKMTLRLGGTYTGTGTAGCLGLYGVNNMSSVGAVWTDALRVGKWSFVCVTWDSDGAVNEKVHWYINGLEIAGDGSPASTPFSDLNNFRFGARLDGGSDYDGKISHFSLIDRTWTSNEQYTVYHSQTNLFGGL